MDKKDNKKIPTTATNDDAAERKDNRIRLSEEELAIIDNYRKSGTLPDESHVLSDVNKASFQTKHADLKRRYQQSLTELDAAQQQIGTLIDLRSTSIKPFKIVPTKGVEDSESTMVLVASDWHLEETIDPSTVNNLNEFNLQIAQRRANNFFKKGLLMYRLLGKNFNINQMVLALLGDFINGYIHEEMMEENSLSPTESILLAKRLLISGIDFLLAECPEVKQLVVPCCIGNHGRTTQKMRISSAHKNSYEWLLYKDLEMHYEKDSRVKFLVSNSYLNYVECYKYLLRFHHGEAIRYSGGIGGLSIPTLKAIASWNKSIPAYLDVFGHFHQSNESSSFISNGSLVGYNPYATFIKAPYETPMQSMFVINQNYGRILSAPIFLED